MRSEPIAEPLSQSPIDISSPEGLLRSVRLPQGLPISPPRRRSMTSTIALLPSSPLDTYHGNPFTHEIALPQPRSHPHPSDDSQRPKLTLNTTSTRRILGKGNTGIRLDNLSAYSPTVQNTYKNSYDVIHNQAIPSSSHDAMLDRSTRIMRTPSSAPATPHPHPSMSPSSSNTSTSTRSLGSSEASAIELEAAKAAMLGGIPYTRTPNLHPILANTPLPEKHVCTPRSAARRHRRRPNSVSFHVSLTEEIRTSQYVAKHSDLLDVPSPRGEKRASPEIEEHAASYSGTSSSESDSHDESCPKTPVAGRKKRRQDWAWTLGPLEGVKCRTPDAPDFPSGGRASPSEGPIATIVAPVAEIPRLAIPLPRKR